MGAAAEVLSFSPYFVVNGSKATALLRKRSAITRQCVDEKGVRACAKRLKLDKRQATLRVLHLAQMGRRLGDDDLEGGSHLRLNKVTGKGRAVATPGRLSPVT